MLIGPHVCLAPAADRRSSPALGRYLALGFVGWLLGTCLFVLDGRRLSFVREKECFCAFARGAHFRPLGLGFVVGSSPFHFVAGSEQTAGPCSRAGAFPFDPFSDARAACSRAAGLEFCPGLTPPVALLCSNSGFLFESSDSRARVAQN